MKTVAAIGALCIAELLISTKALAQGQVWFYNRATSGTPAPVVAPVFGVDPDCPTCTKRGNPTATWNGTNGPAPSPTGTQTYGGAPLQGTGYSAALWGVDDTQPDSLLTDPNAPAVAIVPFQVTTKASLRGFWYAESVIVPGVACDPGVRGKFIVRAWDNRGGTVTNFAQVLQLCQSGTTCVPWGESSIFTVPSQLCGGGVAAPNLAGFESFQLVAAPEPTPLLIFGLAAASALAIRSVRTRRYP